MKAISSECVSDLIPTLDTRHPTLVLLDHFIRPRDKVGSQCQPDLLRRLQVDHKLKLRCLLHR